MRHHIEEAQLNEYLDGLLEPTEHEAVAAHLATCNACQETLADIQLVFTALAHVAEVPLVVDLSERIMAQTTAVPRFNRWATLLLLGQLIGAIVVLILLWPTLLPLWQVAIQTSSELWTPITLPTLDIGTSLQQWWDTVGQSAASITFNLANNQWLLLLSLTLIAWLIGNTLLLAPAKEPTWRE